MAADLEAPTAEQVAAHYHESLVRKRSARRLMWGVGLAFVLVLLLVPGAFYAGWQMRSQALLKQELDAIKQSGQPLTTAEMQAWYKVPAGTRDLTPVWLDALAPFGTPQYKATCRGVPIVGTGWTELPLDQPLATADEQAICTFLQSHRDLLAQVRHAAQQSGEVRYAFDFRHGVMAPVDELGLLREVTRVLRLEFELLAREADLTAAFINLETRLAAADTLKQQRPLSDGHFRNALHAYVMHDIRRLIAANRLSDEEMARLQHLLRSITSQDSLPDAILVERALQFQLFHHDLGFVPDMHGLNVPPRETSYVIGQIHRPEDCALSLAMLARALEASRPPLPTMLDSLRDLEQEMQPQFAGPVQLQQVRYKVSADWLNNLHAYAQAMGQNEALRQILDMALAMERYHLRHHRPAATFDELVPDFLPHMPIDPFDGQPLRLRVQEDSLVVYSIGRDQVDDGGACQLPGQEPDIAIEIKLPETP